jgi:hypothetical protein
MAQYITPLSIFFVTLGICGLYAFAAGMSDSAGAEQDAYQTTKWIFWIGTIISIIALIVLHYG